MTVRVPNERDNKGTTKVDVRLPDGIYSLSYKKVPGWKIKVTKRKLDTPVEPRRASPSTSATRASSFTARKSGIIRPGQFEEFPLSVRVPDGDAGDVLLFPRSRPTRAARRCAGPARADADRPRRA